MGKWAPCKRRDFIRKLKRVGFDPPRTGGKAFLYALWDIYAHASE